MKTYGFTLVEVLIVIALIGIILSIAVPNYNDTMKKAQIEKQTKELHSIIVTARLSAMQNKQPGAIFLGSNSYVYRVYTSLNYPISTGFKTIKTDSFPFVLFKNPSGTTILNPLDVSTDNITFDTRGFTNNDMTLVVTPLKYSGGDDCIVVHTSRTNVGRMENASSCTTR